MENIKTQKDAFSVETLAVYTPVILFGYFCIHFLLRISLSANLEVDEAQFLRSVDFRLIYENSHPPLYNWLVRGALELTGWHWPVSVSLVKNLILFGTYMLGFDLIRRLTGDVRAGLLLVVSFLLLPQIVWQSQVTLAHSVLVAFAVVATFHAFVGVVQNGHLGNYVWLGLACAIGVLAKFNFFIFLLSFVMALVSLRAFRAYILTSKIYASLLVLLILTVPVLISAVINLENATYRMNKLYKTDGGLNAFDLPFVGLDGLISYWIAIFAWGGLVFIIWFLASRQSEELKNPQTHTQRAEFARLFKYTSLVGLLIFALIVFFSDMHKVHERYLTPLMMSLPFWLVLAVPLEHNRNVMKAYARLGAVILMLVPLGFAGHVIFGKHKLAFPYQQFSEGLEKKFGEGLVIYASNPAEWGNIARYIPSAQVLKRGEKPAQVVVIWIKDRAKTPGHLIRRLGPEYEPVGDVFIQRSSYYFADTPAQMSAQLFRLSRVPVGSLERR